MVSEKDPQVHTPKVRTGDEETAPTVEGPTDREASALLGEEVGRAGAAAVDRANRAKYHPGFTPGAQDEEIFGLPAPRKSMRSSLNGRSVERTIGLI